jgi:carbon storage regulator
MLVLSRKESQRIRLGDSIVVTIVKISGDKVRVGIEAPTSILVLRDELEPHPSATAERGIAEPLRSPSADATGPVLAAECAPLRHIA